MKNLILRKKMPCPTLAQVNAYILSAKWVHIDTWEKDGEAKAYIYTDPVDGAWEVTIPSMESWSDYEWRISEAINIIANVENRDTLDVYQDIVKPEAIAAAQDKAVAEAKAEAEDYNRRHWE